MKDLQNKPGVTIALIIILIGAIAVTVIRIKGSTAVAGDRAVAQEPQAAARANSLPPMDDVPSERDPFGHSVLFTDRVDVSRLTEGMPDQQFPTGKPLPMLPVRIEGMKAQNAQITPMPPNSRTADAAKPAAGSPSMDLPKLNLQAVVSGDNPLAVIKDSTGKTHFVHEGDQLGDGVIVAKIIDGTVAVRYGGSFSILSLERGSGGNGKTQ